MDTIMPITYNNAYYIHIPIQNVSIYMDLPQHLVLNFHLILWLATPENHQIEY